MSLGIGQRELLGVAWFQLLCVIFMLWRMESCMIQKQAYPMLLMPGAALLFCSILWLTILN
jgi:uncharacterized membrane protein